MSLITDIKTDLGIARYARNSAVVTLLSTLLGDTSMIGKTKRNGESTDEEVASVVKKFIAGMDENIQIYSFIDENSEKVKKLKFEKEVISKYLPVQLTDEELLRTIKDIISSTGMSNVNQVGLIMSELKKNFNGKYDGAKAIQFARESLV